jgi:type IV secretory pathway VirB6-like protein
MLRARLLLLLALSLEGCEAPAAAAGPETAFSAFSDALRRGDARTAYDALSSSTHTAVEARARAISEASKGVIKNEPAALVFQSGVKPQAAGEVKLVRQDDASAVLAVGSPPSEVHLLKENGRWVVDLSMLYTK